LRQSHSKFGSVDAKRMSSCEGKVAIVTGSSAGIGKATAIMLASRGALVTLHGRRTDRLDEVAAQIKQKYSTECVMVCGNIEDESVRSQLVEKTLAKHGKIDILVNNAGYVITGSYECSMKDIQDMFDCHVLAPFDLSQKCMPHLLETKGSIIMNSSIAGIRGVPGFLPYCTAKAATDNMMRCMALDVAARGVRVNSINAGLVDTELLNDQKTIKEKWERQPPHPIGRVLEVDEVAELICFLGSDASKAITGSLNLIDGGNTASLVC